MLPPTHKRDPNRKRSYDSNLAQLVSKALAKSKYIRENPNSPEAQEYRKEMERETDLDRAARPTFEAIERACTITAADLAVYVGPGTHNPNY